MAVYLTNGKYYITHSSTGKLVKVNNKEEAKDFVSVGNAIAHKNKHPGKCAGYYYIDSESEMTGKTNYSPRRKKFSASERLQIYRKTEGHCYLCGEFVDYDTFEIEHRIPLAKGGKNDFDNLFCACHTCNSIKQSIHPLDFMERINKIYMYQMEMKYKNKLRWKIMYNFLMKLT